MRKKAMSSEKASFVKIEGHRIERVYADLIGGQTISGTREDYIKNKEKYKERLQNKMGELKNILMKPNNKKKFFFRAFSNNQIHYFVVYDNKKIPKQELLPKWTTKK